MRLRPKGLKKVTVKERGRKKRFLREKETGRPKRMRRVRPTESRLTRKRRIH